MLRTAIFHTLALGSWLLPTLLLATACDGDDTQTSQMPATVNQGGAGGSAPRADAGKAQPDAGRGKPDAGPAKPDAGSSVPDAGSPKPDAGRTPPDAGLPTADAGAEPCMLASTPRAPVLVDCVQRVVMRGGVGFGPPEPPGSSCRGERSYTLELGSRQLAWSVCEVDFASNEPWRVRKGMRVLEATEHASLVEALGKVTIAGKQSACGADKGLLTLEISSADDSELYTDSFYACTDASKLYVDNIDDVFTTVARLAQP